MHQKTKSGFPAIHKTFRKTLSAASRIGQKQPARGKGELDSQARLLLIVHFLFITAGALSGTFVNVYLWKVKSQFAPIAWFTFATHLAGALTFWLAGAWVKHYNKMNALRLGMAGFALFYLLVLVLGTDAVSYAALLGVVQGMAAGFFWLAFNVVYFEITEPDNRDLFNGWTGLLTSGGGMLAPWISGLLISRLTDARGYPLIFTLSLALFVAGVVVSFFLKKRQSEGVYSWTFAVRSLREDADWRWAFGALAGQGLREGVFGFIIGLLVYIATKSEMTLGNYWLMTSAVGLVSSYLVGKWLKPRYRKWGMLCGALAIIAAVLPVFWQVSYVTLLVFGVAVGLFYPLYSFPIVSTVFDLIGSNEESARNRVEYVVLREFGLAVGRMLGILAFLVVTSFSTSAATLNGLILAIGMGPLVAWLCMRRLFSRVVPAGGNGE